MPFDRISVRENAVGNWDVEFWFDGKKMLTQEVAKIQNDGDVLTISGIEATVGVTMSAA
jgi:hypothetical protein